MDRDDEAGFSFEKRQETNVREKEKQVASRGCARESIMRYLDENQRELFR